jgi:hypothetical protein
MVVWLPHRKRLYGKPYIFWCPIRSSAVITQYVALLYSRACFSLYVTKHCAKHPFAYACVYWVYVYELAPSHSLLYSTQKIVSNTSLHVPVYTCMNVQMYACKLDPYFSLHGSFHDLNYILFSMYAQIDTLCLNRCKQAIRSWLQNTHTYVLIWR